MEKTSKNNFLNTIKYLISNLLLKTSIIYVKIKTNYYKTKIKKIREQNEILRKKLENNNEKN